MSLLNTLFSVITYLFRNVFGKSDQRKLGEVETRLESIQKSVEIRDEMSKAEKPESDKNLDDLLRSGKLSFLLIFLLSACAHSPTVITCPTLKNWTGAEQSRMADELLLLPKDSLVRSAMKDYAYMRNQARTCNTYRE